MLSLSLGLSLASRGGPSVSFDGAVPRGLQSLTEVGAPNVFIVSLTAIGVESATEVGTPLTGLVATATGVASATEVGSPTATSSAEITFGTATYTRGSAGTLPDFTVPDLASTGLSGGDYTVYLGVYTSATTDDAADLIAQSGDAAQYLSVGPETVLGDLDSPSLNIDVTLAGGANDAIRFVYVHSGGTQSSVGTVANITHDHIAPAFSSAVIENADPDAMILTLDKDSYVATGETLAVGDFTFGGDLAAVVNGVVRTNATTYTFSLSRAAVASETLTVALSSGTLVGIDAEAVSFTAQNVTNNVAAADVTAPTLSSPVDAANGSTASTGSVDTNEGNGTLYWVVTTSATAPSAAQVKAGQDNTGTAADGDSGSQSVSTTGTQTLSPAPSGLTASTAYTTHFMHEDAATNQSTVSSASGFTTAVAPSLTATRIPIQGTNTGSTGTPEALTFTIDTSAFSAGDALYAAVNVQDADEASTLSMTGAGTKINTPPATTGSANMSVFKYTLQPADIGATEVVTVEFANLTNNTMFGAVVVSGTHTNAAAQDDWDQNGAELSVTVPSADIASATNRMLAFAAGTMFVDDTSTMTWGVSPDDREDRYITSAARSMAIAIFENVNSATDFTLTADGDFEDDQALCVVPISAGAAAADALLIEGTTDALLIEGTTDKLLLEA